MTNYFIGILILLFFAGCTPHNGYVLTGKVPEAWEGKPVVLMAADVKQPYALDSTTVSNGSFQLKGQFDLPRYCRVLIFLDPENRQNPDLIVHFPLFLDSTAVEAVCDYVGQKPKITLSGGVTQAEFDRFTKALELLRVDRKERFTAYTGVYYNKKDDLPGAMELARQVTVQDKEIRRVQLQYLKDHPESVVSLNILQQLCDRYSELSVEEMQQLFEQLSPRLQDSEMGKDLAKIIQERKIVIGKPFPDVELKGVDGEIKKISDFIRPGHFTLIEFWASWCSPCRSEIPFIKRAYAEYHPKGFEIVSISIDRDEAAWKEALKDENLPWGQLLDNTRTAFATYETSAVPTSILVDDRGNILKLDARGAWLDIALQEIYN